MTIDDSCKGYLSYLIHSAMAKALHKEDPTKRNRKRVRRLKIKAMEDYREAATYPRFEEAKLMVEDLVSSDPLDFSEWAKDYGSI